MKNHLRLFGFSLFILLTACCFASSTQARWGSPVPPPFAGTIHIVKFLDAQGAPLQGIVGDSDSIQYTTTGGQTPTDWHVATITGSNPGTNFPTGWVNDISFENATMGAAIITGNTNPLDSGLLLTSDGGQTWHFSDYPGTPDSGSGIYWSSTNHLLFVSSLDKGLVVSADSGKTWKIISSSTHFTGFAFMDPDNGVVATYGSQANGFPPSYSWLRTADGGLTWTPCQMFFECWQPVAIPSTQTYFASTDHYTGDKPMLLRSDNGGYSFVPCIGYNGIGDTLTQDIAGDGCSLYAPSQVSLVGLWYSVSDGGTWTPFADAPAPPVNTRIYVSPTTVWSFTDNRLQFADRMPSVPVHLYPSDTMAFRVATCGHTSDTVFHVLGCVCGDNDIITGITITQSAASGFTVDPPGSLPFSLCASLSSPEGTPAAIGIHYSPSSITPDVGVITIHYTENGTPDSMTIGVWGNGVTPGITLVDPSFTSNSSRITLNQPACGDTLTRFYLVNTSCTNDTITNSTLSEDDSDMCFLQISSGQLPAVLTPGSSYEVDVLFQAKLLKALTTAGIVFNWKAGSTFGQTNPVAINAFTTTNTHPVFRGLNFTAADCCDVPDDTTIYFVNSTTCPDSLILYAPEFLNASDPLMFSLDTALMLKKGFRSPIFPIKVPPNSFLPLTIHIADCHGGTFHTDIRFNYAFGSGKGSCAQAATGSWDTTLTMHVGTTGNTSPTASTTNLQWVVNCCDTTEVKTLTITGGCKWDTLQAPILFDDGNGHFDTLSSLLPSGVTLPYPLAPKGQPGDKLVLSFRFRKPVSGSAFTGSIKLNFESSNLNPTTTTLITQLTGSCTAQPVAPLSSNVIDFGTLACGQGACDSVLMKGSPCGAVKVGFIQGPQAGSPFTLDYPATGTQINQGDSTEVRVCINPSDTGNVSGMIIFGITDLSGVPGIPDTLYLSGYLTPPSPGNTVTQLAATNMCDTSTLDESFTVVNTGSCYTYVLTGASSTNGSKVTTTPYGTSYPVHIAPGDTQEFTVHFDPQGQAGTLNGSVSLADSAGQTITIPYDITVDTCNKPSGRFTVSMPTDTIFTANCTVGVLAFTANAGGGSGTITSVSLSGTSSRFQLTNSSGGAMPFTDSITFDPNNAGGNQSSLTINYQIDGTPGDTTIPLTGLVTGAKYTARIGVASPTNNCLLANDTETKELDVVLRDAIPDSLGMTKLSFLIHYDGDILFDPTTLSLAPGFTLASENADTMGLHITLNYTPTGSGGISTNTTVIAISQKAAIAKLLATTARIDSAHFNDSAYEACTLRALSSSTDSANICVDTGICQTNLIYQAMNGTLQPMTGIMIVPNPAQKGESSATLRFTTHIAAPVMVDVVNELGNPVAQLAHGSMTEGDHTIAIPTEQMTSGAYFIRISMNGYTMVRTFILEKE